MSEQLPQKDAMDVLQTWVDDYNARARPAIRLASAGEAGGAQLRLKDSPAGGQGSIFPLGAVRRDGRPALPGGRVDGTAAEHAVQARPWASEELGRP